MRPKRAAAEIVEEFTSKRYVVIKQFISKSQCEDLFFYTLRRSTGGGMKPDTQVAGAPAAYSDPRMERLLLRSRPVVERITGLKLFPTYSYLRAYQHGSELNPHRDRCACEISVTLSLGLRGASSWPIWIEGPQGPRPVSLKPGDGIVYRGIECLHWREPFDGDVAVQVFLHYVDKNGPHSGWKFDKRKTSAPLS